MRVLIAIISCARDLMNGNNQVVRDTWLKNISFIKNFEYKFFIGNGLIDKELLIGDEILLDVQDDYASLSYKVKETRRWALDNGYDYIFKCDTDTYVHLNRLSRCGFEKHDYIGYACPLEGRELEMLKELKYDLSGTYAGGGAGYWLSRKACESIVDASVNIFCEDVWTGYHLHINKVLLHNDYNYCYHIGNMADAITVHLGNGCHVYDSKDMYQTSILFDKYKPIKMPTTIKRRFQRPYRTK